MELIKKYKWPILLVSLIAANMGWTIYSDQMDKSRVYLADNKQIADEVSSTANKEVIADDAILNREAENSPKDLQPEIKEDIVPQQIPIYICGEVKSPGVYYMSEGAIINEVIEKSGGFTQEANTLAVNLAAAVKPNEKIIIPKQGEEIDKLIDSYDNRERTEDESASLTDINETESGLININTASKEALMTLIGVGEVKASAIIAYRQEKGSFNSIDEIRNISGIGEKTFEKIKQFITT